jgi:hypothetical protein
MRFLASLFRRVIGLTLIAAGIFSLLGLVPEIVFMWYLGDGKVLPPNHRFPQLAIPLVYAAIVGLLTLSVGVSVLPKRRKRE